MCGIFGYVGPSTSLRTSKRGDAAKIVFEGLKTLEYRGYDSWGIATLNQKLNIKDKKLIIEKHVGKLPPILNSQLSTLNSNVALGHTRWATHGGVTEANAHPHTDCTGKISAVHNGIVENWEELKKSLSKNHNFKSQTDTEVVVHLVEELAKKLPFEEAVRRAFLKLKGLNAFIFLKNDGEIVAVKSGSPLVVGLGENEVLIASDSVGLLPFTNRAVFIEDGEMVVISQKEVKVIDALDGTAKKLQVSKISAQKDTSVGGNKFPHIMLSEIYDQPKVLRSLAEGDQAAKLADLVNKAFGIFFVACGSASYAALSGTYLFSRIAKKHVNFSIGSEFKYQEDYIHKGTLVVPVSQSGESVDVIEPVLKAKKKGAKIAALVNVEGSTLFRIADFNFLLGAWPERAVVATKSLTAMVAALIMTAYSLAGKGEESKKLITAAALDIERFLANSQLGKIKRLAKRLSRVRDVYIIGRGLSYAVALEVALKLKEACYLHAEGFAGGELKHGVIALVEKGTPCIVFAPNDETYDEIISNAQEVKARGAYIIGIGPQNNQVFDDFVKTGDLAEATMISQIVVSQLLAYFIAVEKGIDPDKPRNLAKSVTVK